jgi:uncharacterized protein (DUF305 family)
MSAATTDLPTGTAVEPTRRSGAGILALATVVGVLLGFAIGALLLRPDPAPGDASAEAGFARDMSAHHDQAVTMGMIAYRNAADPDVRQLGYDIAMTQQGQIGMMQQWLRGWDLLPTGSGPPMAWMEGDPGHGLIRDGNLMPGMATREQLTRLEQAEGVEVDRMFLELMTDHHLGGIHMIDGVQARSDHPEVLWLAGLMEAGQASEIEAMRSLLADLDRA